MSQFFDVGGAMPCDLCDHPRHEGSECGEVVGYDHLNGDHECGCPGSLESLLAQAWDEGHTTCCDDRCFSDGNPYRRGDA